MTSVNVKTVNFEEILDKCLTQDERDLFREILTKKDERTILQKLLDKYDAVVQEERSIRRNLGPY